MSTVITPAHGAETGGHSNTIPSTALDAPVVVGLLAEYSDVTSVTEAAKKVRDAGFKHWDVYTPFPIHGIDAAMGIKPTVLPWIVLAMGVTGCLFGIVLTAWINAFEFTSPKPFDWVNFQGYQFMISGKPFWSLPANIPIIFETTVMFAAYTAVFGMFLLNKLPMMYNPLFKIEKFRRATDDRFFIAIDAGDVKYDPAGTVELLKSTKPESIETIED
jgi:hypothetical protein